MGAIVPDDYKPLDFWKRIERTSTCWLWKGTCKKSGHGVMSIGGKSQQTHRVAFELCFGSIPDGFNVCHHCDVPNCVRPDHLYLGTPAHNMTDVRHRNRGPHLSDLTIDDVIEIRELYRYRQWTTRSLAVQFGVSHSTINNIVNRDAWAWVPDFLPPLPEFKPLPPSDPTLSKLAEMLKAKAG